MVRNAINRLREWWRGFLTRHTFYNEPPLDIDWDDVMVQAEKHHNDFVETMAQLHEEQAEENVKDTKHLRSLFEARDEAHKQCTMVILETLQPTLITAVLEFFELKNTEVTWIHVSINDGSLALIGTIAEGASVKETEAERQVADALSQAGVSTAPRYLRVGIPVDIVEGGSKQDILDYFKKVSDDEETRTKEAEAEFITHLSESTGFDMSELTEEQRTSLVNGLYTNETDTKQ